MGTDGFHKDNFLQGCHVLWLYWSPHPTLSTLPFLILLLCHVCVCTQSLCHLCTVTENTQYLAFESGIFHFLWRPPVASISRQFCPFWLNKLPHVYRICCVHLAVDGQADCHCSLGVMNSAVMRMINSASLSHHVGFILFYFIY